jgi:hypothetical protein
MHCQSSHSFAFIVGICAIAVQKALGRDKGWAAELGYTLYVSFRFLENPGVFLVLKGN